MRTTWLLLLCLTASLWTASAQEECFGILAGRSATADASVLLGHNEDDGGEQMVNLHVVPRHRALDRKSIGTEAARFLWAELPGQEVADAFMNEYGVSVASDNCPSRETEGRLTDGGVLYEVRLNVARFARSAREAVRIIGNLVENYGYRGSGRTYIVADPREGWLVSVVNGKHWVAQRVPDDHVALVSNFYVIDAVDLTDTLNFAGSPDIIQYAVDRGWYNPIREGTFSFRRAYASEESRRSRHNVRRMASALEQITGRDYGTDPDRFPFSVVPRKRISASDVMAVLASHGEKVPAAGSDRGSICNNNTVLSTVFQLRTKPSPVLGCVMWTAVGHPAVEPYLPLCLGIEKLPRHFGRYNSWSKALEKHLADASDLRKRFPKGIYWPVADRWTRLTAPGADDAFFLRQAEAAAFQKKVFIEYRAFEAECAALPEKKQARRAASFFEKSWKSLKKSLGTTSN